MKSEEFDLHFKWLVKSYFSNPSCWIKLKTGEVLIRQGHYNNRLYLVRKGEFQGYIETETGLQKDTLRAGPNNFIGVYSYFSRTYQSMATVESTTDSEVAYIERYHQVVPTDFTKTLEEQFMPIVVADLMRRQNSMLELNQQREQTLKKLVNIEKMASLGQLAAGIAHELNNAIAVLARNTHWLVEKYNALLTDEKTTVIFEAGLLRGRYFSSREVRQRRKISYKILNFLSRLPQPLPRLALMIIYSNRIQMIWKKQPKIYTTHGN